MIDYKQVLVTGGTGQVGSHLVSILSQQGAEVTAPTRLELDLRDPQGVQAWLQGRFYDAIFNAAAYTAVDQAEQDKENAWMVNVASPTVLARFASHVGADFLHYGTDYVFAGYQGPHEPLSEATPPSPLGVYAMTKFEGEQAVRSSCPEALVVRTSGVYNPGGTNFVEAILKRLASHGKVQVVDDQFTLPTPAEGLAVWTIHALRDGATGLLHLVPDGAPSWFRVAQVIGGAYTKRTGKPVTVEPTTSSTLRRPAPRPPWSVLSPKLAHEALGIRTLDWRVYLEMALENWPMENGP